MHQSNKEVAISFLTMVTAGTIREAYEQYIASNFRHHNPYFKGDARSLMDGMEQNEKEHPGKLYTMHRALEDGDLVAVHGHVRFSADNPGISVVHIFRFEDSRIVEMWDIAQPLPKDSSNENGPF